MDIKELMIGSNPYLSVYFFDYGWRPAWMDQ